MHLGFIYGFFIDTQYYNTMIKILQKIISFFMLSRKHTYYTLILSVPFFLSCSEDDSLSSEDGELTTDDVIMTSDDDIPTTGNTLSFLDTQIYGGSQVDTFQDIKATTDGGAIAIGHSQSIDGDIVDNNTQINKVWVVKTDADQNISWSKTYGGSDDDRGTHIIETTDGGYAFVGFTKSNDGDLTENAGFFDHWIVKLDASGTIEWQKSFGFSGSDQAFSITQTSDGGFFTAGFLDVSASDGAGNDGFTDHTDISTNSNRATQHGVGEFWGHKVDEEGNLLWRRYFGGTNNDRAFATVPSDDGGILMAGASESNDFDITQPNGSYDFWAVRLDSTGTLLWEKSLGGSEIDNAYTVTKTQDGGYLIAGDTRSSDGDVSNFRGSADVWLVKLSDGGDLIWEKTLGGSNFDTARAVTSFSDGFVIAGASRSADDQVTENNGQSDIWITLTDTEGNLLDQHVIGGNGLDFGYGIAINDQREIFIAGDTDSTNGSIIASQGATDAVIIKLKID